MASGTYRGGFGSALKRFLIEKEAKRQQMVLEEAQGRELLMREKALFDQQEERRLNREQQAQQDRMAASANANVAGLRNLFADRLTQGPITAAEAPTLQSIAVREGVQLPSYMQPPAPAAQEKLHQVTTVDPVTGRKVKKLVTESELRVGVPEPPDEDSDIKEVGGYIYEKQGGRWTRTGVSRDKSSGGPAEPKPPTQGQQTADAFYRMATSASGTLDQYESQIGTLDKLTSIPFLQSQVGQQYQQAKSQWIRAVLRKESGAAIGADEFDGEDKTFFPQVGDSAAVIAQKARMRKEKEASIRVQGSSGSNDSGGNTAAPPRSKYRVTVR